MKKLLLFIILVSGLNATSSMCEYYFTKFEKSFKLTMYARERSDSNDLQRYGKRSVRYLEKAETECKDLDITKTRKNMLLLLKKGV